jgi:hypothetical protein
LERIGQLGPEQYYEPAEIKPEHKQRNGGNSTVYGVQPGYKNLGFKIQILKQGKYDTGKNRCHDGATVFDLEIRNKFVHGRKCQYRYYAKYYPAQEGFNAFRESNFVGNKGIQYMGIDYGTGEKKHDDERRQAQDGNIKRKSFEYIPGLLHFPYIIEYTLHAHHHPNNQPNEQKGAYQAQYTGMGCPDYIVRKAQHRIDNLLIVEIGI